MKTKTQIKTSKRLASQNLFLDRPQVFVVLSTKR